MYCVRLLDYYIILFSQFLFASGLPGSSHDYELSEDDTTISTSGDIFENSPPFNVDRGRALRF